MTSIEKIIFTKAVASGNDFIIIDNKDKQLNLYNLNYSDLAKELCHRNFSIGADGILVLEESDKATFKMRIINSDGSEVAMCGNGTRCSALYASINGWEKNLTIETGAGILDAIVNKNNVKVKMTDPKDMNLNIQSSLFGFSNNEKVYFVNTGVEHVVCIVDNIQKYDIKTIGRNIRNNDFFAPKGTNVNFVEIKDKENINIRTYERGVEDETLACGTGSVASAIVLGFLGIVNSPVKVKTKSGEVLTISYSIVDKKIENVYMEGTAKLIFKCNLLK